MKSKYIQAIFFLFAVSTVISCESKKDKSELLDTVLKTEEYIRTASLNNEFGKGWRVMPDSASSTADLSLYSGTPGVVLFYLELYQARANELYLEEAKKGADFLIASLSDKLPTSTEVGLYTGLGGTGYTLMSAYNVTKEERYKEGVLRTIDLIEKSSEKTENGIHWGKINDIVYGSSGLGLYLNYIADELEYKKADSLSVLVADGLLDHRIDTLGGMRWFMMPSLKDRFMDNFSHGTSGVGYYLTEMYIRTNDQKYLDAALDAAKVLDHFTTEEGLIPHHTPGGEELFYLSWCHGPSGTSRFYYMLWKATREKIWLDKIQAGAEAVLASGIDKQETPGFWNNVGRCCGTAGVAEYFLWTYEITNDDRYLEYSKILTEKLVNSSELDSQSSIKWVHAENRTSPNVVAAQTGLMQGSAGIGMWLLQLDAYERGRKSLINLPDKPIVKD